MFIHLLASFHPVPTSFLHDFPSRLDARDSFPSFIPFFFFSSFLNFFFSCHFVSRFRFILYPPFILIFLYIFFYSSLFPSSSSSSIAFSNINVPDFELMSRVNDTHLSTTRRIDQSLAEIQRGGGCDNERQRDRSGCESIAVTWRDYAFPSLDENCERCK